MGTQLTLPQTGTVPQFSAHTCCGQMAGWIKMPLGREVGLSQSDIVLDWNPKRWQGPQFSARLLWPNSWMDQDGSWHGGSPRLRPHCARWGPSPLPRKGGSAPSEAPQFSAPVHCGWIKMTLGMKVGLGPGHIVQDGDPAPPPKRGHSPQFSAHVYCGQTAGWIKVPLGMKVGLDSGNFVLHGDPAPPPQKGAQPPIFGPCLLWPRLPISVTA